MFTVYILKSLKDNKFYIGQTSNLEDRLKRHNQGRERSTKNRLPFELVHMESFLTRKEVLEREKYLKALKSHVAIQRIIDSSIG